MKKVIIVLAILSLVIIIGCAQPEIESEATNSTVPDTLQIATEKPIVTFLEFGSKTCIPCKQMVPVLKSIEENYPKSVKVTFYDVRKPQNKDISIKYKIKTIPTQVFLDANGKEFFRHQGFFPEEKIVKLLEEQGVKAE